MWINQIFLGFIGLCCGFLVAGGVFALITSVGIVPRMAGKTHTGNSVKTYEMSIFLGGALGNIFGLFNIELITGKTGAGMFGIFAGVFVGCLAVAIAETLNTTAVFSRRIHLTRGMGYIILGLALGKIAGSIWFFYYHWYK